MPISQCRLSWAQWLARFWQSGSQVVRLTKNACQTKIEFVSLRAATPIPLAANRPAYYSAAPLYLVFRRCCMRRLLLSGGVLWLLLIASLGCSQQALPPGGAAAVAHWHKVLLQHPDLPDKVRAIVER